MDTIFALATAHGKAGVAVIRVSGPLALDCGARVASKPLPARGMSMAHLKDGEGEVIDDALVLSFSAPNSFTGENVVEFQLHGSTAVVDAMLAELGQQDGLRLAEPGEFTRRALENVSNPAHTCAGIAVGTVFRRAVESDLYFAWFFDPFPGPGARRRDPAPP